MYITLEGSKTIHHRESWREMFVIEINPPMVPFVPRGFIPTASNHDRDTKTFWVWYLYLFVKTGHLIRSIWFAPAKYLFNRGWFERYEEGENVSWFWFKHLGETTCVIVLTTILLFLCIIFAEYTK